MNKILSFGSGLLFLIILSLVSCEKDLESAIDFKILPHGTIVPINISFLNQSIHLECFEWDFGDGCISHEISPNHLYQNNGEYKVILKAWKNQEQFIVQKTIYLLKEYQYTVINNSCFKLYNLTTYSDDFSRHNIPVNHGLLKSHESTGKCQTESENLFVKFEDEAGRVYKTIFPYRLKDNVLNELVIDKNTLVIAE